MRPLAGPARGRPARGWPAEDDDAFHPYAFGTCRQCGANAELAAAFVDWLDGRDGGGLEHGGRRFRRHRGHGQGPEFALARAARGRTVDLDECRSTEMAGDWDRGHGTGLAGALWRTDLLAGAPWTCCATAPARRRGPGAARLDARRVDGRRRCRARRPGRCGRPRSGGATRRPSTTTVRTGGSGAGSRPGGRAVAARPGAAWPRWPTSGSNGEHLLHSENMFRSHAVERRPRSTTRTSWWSAVARPGAALERRRPRPRWKTRSSTIRTSAGSGPRCSGGSRAGP